LTHIESQLSARKNIIYFLQMQGEIDYTQTDNDPLSTLKAAIPPFLRAIQNPKSYGQLPKGYWTRRVNLAYVSAYRGPIWAAGGADDRHAQAHTPVASCPKGQPASASSQP
jgi:hypothetical protein